VHLESKKLDALGKLANLLGDLEILLVNLERVDGELRVNLILAFGCD
jgi:hypothetical protein